MSKSETPPRVSAREKGHAVSETTVAELIAQLPDGLDSDLDEILHLTAEKVLGAALVAEAAAYIDAFQEHGPDGRAMVVRNGYAKERAVATGAGVLRVTAPRVLDRRPGHAFQSSILPPYMRKSPRLEEALPILYLRGLSTGDFAPALKVLLGEPAAGFSASTIARLKEQWTDEYRQWRKRDLSDRRFAYLWADGVRFHVRMEGEDLHCLVVIGAREDGTKEVLAIEDGYRESKESWLAVLRDLKRRGLQMPKSITADGGLGLWAAVPEVFPGIAEQLCWKHKMANVLDKLPKSYQPRAKDHLREIAYAPDEETARHEAKLFEDEYGAKYPKATASLIDNLDRLLTFFDFPAEHWVHLRTTNPVESVFSTTKLRTRQTRGAGSRNAALGMAFKLLESAQDRWRRINAPHLAAAVVAGVEFRNGERVKRDSHPAADHLPNNQSQVAA